LIKFSIILTNTISLEQIKSTQISYHTSTKHKHQQIKNHH